MIQVRKSESIIVRVRLNPEKANLGSNIDFVLDSPSRPSITFSCILTEIQSGIYTFPLTAEQTSQLLDDTYYYTIIQGENTLKIGVIMLTLPEGIQGGFDYSLDLTLA